MGRQWTPLWFSAAGPVARSAVAAPEHRDDDPEDRADAEPLGEVHRQRIVDLLSAGGEGSKTGATPADIAIETKPKRAVVHIGAIAEMSKSLARPDRLPRSGPPRFFNRGITHPACFERSIVRHYHVTHAAGIREPFAYYATRAGTV